MGRDLRSFTAARKKRLGTCLGLLRFLFAVNQRGEFSGENLLRLVELFAFPGIHLADLLHRQEGQHADAFEDIGVADISPVLVEIEGRSLVRIKPDGIAGGLAHLLALGIGQKRDGHRMGVLAQLLAD